MRCGEQDTHISGEAGEHASAGLQEDQQRQLRLLLAGRDGLAGEHRNLLTVGPAMIQRDAELVVGQNQARQAVRDKGHRV